MPIKFAIANLGKIGKAEVFATIAFVANNREQSMTLKISILR
jgi:hypothetical protein